MLSNGFCYSIYSGIYFVAQYIYTCIYTYSYINICIYINNTFINIYMYITVIQLYSSFIIILEYSRVEEKGHLKGGKKG